MRPIHTILNCVDGTPGNKHVAGNGGWFFSRSKPALNAANCVLGEQCHRVSVPFQVGVLLGMLTSPVVVSRSAGVWASIVSMILSAANPLRVPLSPVPDTRWFKSGLKSVFAVSLRRNVLKVKQSIVGLYPILMVYLMALWSGTDIRRRNKAMNGQLFSYAIFSQRDDIVARGKGAQFQNPTIVGMRTFGADASAFYASQIRDSVIALKAKHRAPFFRREFFGGKFWISQGMNLLRVGLALVRLVSLRQQRCGPFSFYHTAGSPW